jgi:ABC-type lipoprotein export system ATPase subunit
MERMLPRVFVSEHIPDSDVWKAPVTFRRGETTLVEAASGGGKSSMCAYIFGARTDFEGRLLINNRDSREITIDEWQEIRRRNIAYLPQELSLFPELTAWENIQLKNRLTGHATDKQIEDWLERLGIASRRDYPAGRMSIGQQQRLAIIRSICQPFDFILLDEPVSHLDEENNRIVAGIISEEAKRQGAGIISTSVGNKLLLNYERQLKL